MKLARSLRNVGHSLKPESFRTAHRRFRAAFATSTGENCKPKSQQIRELAQLALRRSFSPEEYFAYRFYERDKGYAEMFRYMPYVAMRETYRPAVNDLQWKPILDNKWIFHQHYAQRGVPMAKLYGYFEAESGIMPDGTPLRSAGDVHRLLLLKKPSSLAIKPVLGIQGQSILILSRLSYDGDRVHAIATDERPMTFEDIMAHLTAQHGIRYEAHEGHLVQGGGYLLEEKLEQHSGLAEIGPYTTNTIRVVTFAEPSGDVAIEFTVLRLGRRGSSADNWAQGGISVALDPATGKLGRGFTKPKLGGEWLDRHPDTQVAFFGWEVPMWREALDLCRHAALVSPHIRSVGWDVLVTPSGPKLIEGNADWDLMMVQVHSNGYLQPHVRERLARYGLRFSGWPPPIDPRGPLMLLRFSN